MVSVLIFGLLLFSLKSLNSKNGYYIGEENNMVSSYAFSNINQDNSIINIIQKDENLIEIRKKDRIDNKVDIVVNEVENSINVVETKWRLEIPKINLVADISEGTSEEILNKYIGHFIDSKFWNGNVALAAHNRGYKVNYFNRIKELEQGDEILYYFGNLKRRYEVYSKEIVNETDLTILDNTNVNVLTLVTCVENKPKLRRCIKAIEVN